ncbi:alpha/beta hydrolase [Aquimarina muelleri]|uniref:Esterase n=1 Tax=Aquimarina muelleri TaxID=279356 RepID=A0A918N511_9FLAO|nr:alpha/beta hydrolase-fold protein [Aquimarina muelleri]MCX2764752.1 alpha/beta hydrolase-fold protein [Aquimarina muelleri]GGX33566.1 esterase [Aquimarina muelleri]
MHKFLSILVIVIIAISCSQGSQKSKTIDDKLNNDGEVISDNEIKKLTSFEIKDTEIHQIQSTINQKHYELYIKLPNSYSSNSDKKYPILVLTDSDYAFPLVTSITRRVKTEEFIIVGISYSKGDSPGVSRTRDYTPTNSPNEERGHSKESRLASGKADDFIAFIKKDIFSFLNNTYRINMSKKVFSGHSFGGLLASYILVTTPDLFEYYLVGSPSLWYDNYCINNFEEKYSNAHTNLRANVFFSIGGKEKNNKSDMVTEMLTFEQRLLSRNYTDLKVKSSIISDEDHFTVYPSFITKGILFAFEK